MSDNPRGPSLFHLLFAAFLYSVSFLVGMSVRGGFSSVVPRWVLMIFVVVGGAFFCFYLFTEVVEFIPVSQQTWSNRKVKRLLGVFICIWLVGLILPWLLPVRSEEELELPFLVAAVAWPCFIGFYLFFKIATRR